MTPQKMSLEDSYFVLYMTEILSDIALDDNFRIPELVDEDAETEE